MSPSVIVHIGTVGYGVSALAYLTLLVLLASRGRGQGSGRLLLLAILLEILWSIGSAWTPSPIGFSPPLQTLAEALRSVAWITFMLSLVCASSVRLLTFSALALALALAPLASDRLSLGMASFSTHLLVAIAALVCLEQVWRNVPGSRRWAMKFLCLALLSKFAFDLVMYSDALLFGQLDAIWWAARGCANSLLVPFFAVAAARNHEWKLNANVSRQVVFHSATLLASGLFLLALALGGYVLRFLGGSWGAFAATLVTFSALLSLLVLMTSGKARSTLRVQLAKHFFTYRYDYRHEWLMLTRRLDGFAPTGETGAAGSAESATLAQRGLRSLADLVECPGGVLWLRDDDGALRCEARLGHSGAIPVLSVDEPWLQGIQAAEKIVDLRRGRDSLPAENHRPAAGADSESAHFAAAANAIALPEWLSRDSKAAFLLPLLLDRELIGIVLLHQPRVDIELDWEVRDLLHIAARQVASYLVMRTTVEALVQARQFESFNRMSAFVVHDLKNLVAQLSLVVRNSERHKGHLAFQEDMLDTVRNVQDRMQGLLLQLGTGAKPVDAPRGVVLSEAIRGAVRSRRALKPVVELELDPELENLEVAAHRDRLERVLGHLIQNAADATDVNGSILLRTRRENGQAVIEIIDTGHGMSENFIREQLFRPFSSTKSGGMGIGVFESRVYIRELSGSIDVASRPQKGTTFIVRLPERVPNRSSATPADATAADGSWRSSSLTDPANCP